MATLDGLELLKGDMVHVLGFGYAQVSRVRSDGGFYARVPGMGEQSFLPGGYKGRERKVYWHDPVIIRPPKDKTFWLAFKSLMPEIYRTLARAYKNDELVVPEADDVDEG